MGWSNVVTRQTKMIYTNKTENNIKKDVHRKLTSFRTLLFNLILIQEKAIHLVK